MLNSTQAIQLFIDLTGTTGQPGNVATAHIYLPCETYDVCLECNADAEHTHPLRRLMLHETVVDAACEYLRDSYEAAYDL